MSFASELRLVPESSPSSLDAPPMRWPHATMSAAVADMLVEQSQRAWPAWRIGATVLATFAVVVGLDVTGVITL